MSVAVHGFAEGEAQARALAEALAVPFGLVQVHRFPDGEVLPTVPEPPRTVIVYRSLSDPNEKLIELLLAAEAWRRRGARRLVLVAPYLAYMRQDHEFAPGQAISQRVMADLIGRTFDRLVTVQAHLHRTPDIGGLFSSIQAESLSAAAPIAQWLAAAGGGRGAVVVAPDIEIRPLAREVARTLGLDWVGFDKVRHGDRAVSLSLEDQGRLQGRAAILLDDICSSGGTLAAAIGRLRELGADEVTVAVIHALMAPQAQALVEQAGASALVSTDSVPHSTNRISLTPLLAAALRSELGP